MLAGEALDHVEGASDEQVGFGWVLFFLFLF
jgi:hypothetical protein